MYRVDSSGAPVACTQARFVAGLYRDLPSNIRVRMGMGGWGGNNTPGNYGNTLQPTEQTAGERPDSAMVT